MTMSAGHMISGGVVSTTVTWTWSVSSSNPSETSSVASVLPSGKFPVGVAESGGTSATADVQL